MRLGALHILNIYLIAHGGKINMFIYVVYQICNCGKIESWVSERTVWSPRCHKCYLSRALRSCVTWLFRGVILATDYTIPYLKKWRGSVDIQMTLSYYFFGEVCLSRRSLLIQAVIKYLKHFHIVFFLAPFFLLNLCKYSNNSHQT